MAIYFERLQQVLNKRQRSRASHYADIQRGTFTPPVKIGAQAVAWPVHEVDAIQAARLAGQSDAEIRDLVQRLVEQRKPA